MSKRYRDIGPGRSEYLEPDGTTELTELLSVSAQLGTITDKYTGKETWLIDPDRGTFSGGTIEEWAALGNNTAVNEAGALKIDYGNNANGAITYLSAAGDLTTNLTVGKTYICRVRAKVNTGATVTLRIDDGVGAYTYSPNMEEFYDWHDIEFVAAHVSNASLSMNGMGAGDIVWIDRWYLVETRQPPAVTAVTIKRDAEVPYTMYFDGLANTDIVMDTTYTLPLAGSTIEVWFKTDADFVAGDRWLLGYTSGGNSYLGFGATGDLELESDTGGDFWLDYAEANIIASTWYHLVVIADGGTVNTYLNDVLIQTTTPTDDVTFKYIGNYSAGNRPYWGWIGIVRLWEGALSVQEANQLHSESKRRYFP